MSFDRRLRAVVLLATVGLVALAATTVARAQTTNASVAGTVQDAQGGVLPGVTVTLTSRTQGNTFTAVTDAKAASSFNRPPDSYTLQFSPRASRRWSAPTSS